ncbi:MAG: ribonuclease HI family protein [Desulfobulbaceae bacterium]|nr:ribonuclease HI family protein [Desulfobulbaceae bacterium]
MPEQKKDREILQILAQRLPEKVLQELLPSVEPEAVRRLLGRLAAAAPSGGYPLQQTLFRGTESAQPDTACSLYTDGAARGNPGEAGAGAVLIAADGAELGVRSLYLGQSTNNAAEYQALIAGLELAAQFDCRALHIFLDSELIVRQIEGSYKVKNEQLKPLFDRVKSQLAQLDKWDIRHIPRQENARADELANRGIDDRK